MHAKVAEATAKVKQDSKAAEVQGMHVTLQVREYCGQIACMS